MNRFRSLLSRIVGLHVLALAAAAVALPLAIYFLLNGTAASYENRTLRAHADTLAHYLSPAPGGGWTLTLPEDLQTFYLHGFDGFAFSVIDANGKVLFSSLRGGAPILRADQRARAPIYFNRRRDKAIYYGASIPEPRGGQVVWIEVAQDLEHPDVIVDDIVADFLSRIAWFIVPILLVLLFADIAIVRRALRPVVHASELAGSVDPARLDLRLPTDDLPLEIVPLVQAFNLALSRLERGFRSLREFTADAAHELRTPLSVLRLRVDTALAPADAELLRKDIDAMTHVVDQLLAAAELETAVVGAGETADLCDVGADVVALLAPIAVGQDKDIALAAPASPVLVNGSRLLLAQAVRNLAENAIAHTPAGTTVEIAVDPAGVVRVTDEGPGIPEDERDLIFRRFWRRDRAHTKGAGLGLAIVRRIVDAHGGSVEADNRPGGGAVFSITLTPSRTWKPRQS
jgi:signal transduction histidine kinase